MLADSKPRPLPPTCGRRMIACWICNRPLFELLPKKALEDRARRSALELGEPVDKYVG